MRRQQAINLRVKGEQAHWLSPAQPELTWRFAAALLLHEAVESDDKTGIMRNQLLDSGVGGRQLHRCQLGGDILEARLDVPRKIIRTNRRRAWRGYLRPFVPEGPAPQPSRS